MALVNLAIRNNLEFFDLMRGSEEYKDNWSNEDHVVSTLTIQATGIIPSIKRSLITVKRKGKIIKRILKSLRHR